MNNEQQDKILMEIHASTKVTASTVQALAKTVWGNGKAGLEADMILVKDRQESCPARKASSIENKRMSIAVVAVIVAVISTIASIAFGVIHASQ
jgi:hypothetical protein